MKFISCLLTVVCLASSVAMAPAAVISRDWKTPGDGLLTYDTLNKREWLDLSQTLLSNFQIPRLDNVLAELQPGGLFEGFTFAKSADVTSLAQSAEIDTGTLEYVTNHVPTSNLVSLVGGTSPSGSSSFGLIDELTSLGVPTPTQQFASISVNSNLSLAGLSFIAYGLGDRPHLITGVMLYRVVPEPAGLILAACGVVSFAGAHRINQNISSY